MMKSLRIYAAVYLACAALGVNAAGWASPTPPKTIHFDIEAPSMAEALIQFTQQSGLQLVFPTEGSTHVAAPKVIGTYTPAVALEKLLQGTGLKYEFANARTVLIKNPVTTSSTNSSEEFQVAQTERELSTGSAATKADQTLQPSSESSAQLQEIVVTAQRHEESIDKVPVSLTALSQQTMDNLHIETVDDLSTVVPGLWINVPGATGGQDFIQISIRGVVSSDNSPTTQLYIDETPVAIRQMQGAGNSGSPTPMIFDLDHVEVLRGPQGTLFGASAMGGAIRFITPQPSLTTSSGFAKTEFGFMDGASPTPNYEIGAAYGGPLVQDKLGFRVSAWYQSTGGFIDQESPYSGQITARNINGSDAYVIRPALSFAPIDDLTVTSAAFLQQKHSDNPPGYWLTTLPDPQSNQHITGSFAQPLEDDLRVYSLAIKYIRGGLMWQSDTSYEDRELASNDDVTAIFEDIFGGNPVYPGLQSFHSYEYDISFTHAFQQEFRLSNQDSSARVNWVAGLYYRKAIQGLSQLLPPDYSPLTEAITGNVNETSQMYFGVPDYDYNGQQLASYTSFKSADISQALFGDVTVNLLPRLKAELGVRVDRQQVQDQHQLGAGPLEGTFNVYLNNQAATPVTPRASLTYQYTDNDMVYTSAAKGYRPGGGNSESASITNNPACNTQQDVQVLQALGLSNVPKTFSSDSLWSYEIGSKNQLWDHRLALESSIYYIDWNNIQVDEGLPSCAEAFTINNGHGIGRGGDLQLEAQITPELKAQLLYGYTRLRAAGGEKPWSVALNVEYAHDISVLWDNSKGYLRADYRLVAASIPGLPITDPVAAEHPDQAYGMLNVRLGVQHGGWDVSAYVNNLTNADPFGGFGHIGDWWTASVWLPPRVAGLTAWYRF